MLSLRSIVPREHPERITRLNTLLATALYFQDVYKRYHWMVTGPHFLPLHELFDEHLGTLEHEVDDLGERIRVLGGTPVWDPTAYARKSILPEPDDELTEDLKLTQEAFEMEARYADALREAAGDFGDDLATQDLLIEYLRIHEKQAWFLREYVRKLSTNEYDARLLNPSEN